MCHPQKLTAGSHKRVVEVGSGDPDVRNVSWLPTVLRRCARQSPQYLYQDPGREGANPTVAAELRIHTLLCQIKFPIHIDQYAKDLIKRLLMPNANERLGDLSVLCRLI